MEEIVITRVVESIGFNGNVYVRQQQDGLGRWIFVREDGTEDDELVCSDIYSDNPEIFHRTFTLTSITVGGEPMIDDEEDE